MRGDRIDQILGYVGAFSLCTAAQITSVKYPNVSAFAVSIGALAGMWATTTYYKALLASRREGSGKEEG